MKPLSFWYHEAKHQHLLVLFSVRKDAVQRKNRLAEPLKDILALSVIICILFMRYTLNLTRTFRAKMWCILILIFAALSNYNLEMSQCLHTKLSFIRSAISNKLTNPLIHPGKGLPVSQKQDISNHLSRIRQREEEEQEGVQGERMWRLLPHWALPHVK